VLGGDCIRSRTCMVLGQVPRMAGESGSNRGGCCRDSVSGILIAAPAGARVVVPDVAAGADGSGQRRGLVRSWLRSTAPNSGRMRQDGDAGQGARLGQVPCGQPLVPTGIHDPFESFRIRPSTRAPLRNRTVDLLLTMHTSVVWCHRITSDYRRSEGLQCPSKSRSVCHRLTS